jgi:hypothetical protein
MKGLRFGEEDDRRQPPRLSCRRNNPRQIPVWRRNYNRIGISLKFGEPIKHPADRLSSTWALPIPKHKDLNMLNETYDTESLQGKAK